MKAGATASKILMEKSQAQKILELNKPEYTEEEVEEQFKKLFNLNSKESGGSPYLQAKFANARETLLFDMKNFGSKAEEEPEETVVKEEEVKEDEESKEKQSKEKK